MIVCNSFAIVALTLLSLDAAAPVLAQNTPSPGNPAGMAPNTPGIYDARPDIQHPNSADELFAREARIGGEAEVQAGRLAARKTQNPAVKDFANRMVSDHSTAADRLDRLLKEPGYSTSTQMDKDHRAVMEQLGKSTGKAFDELYIRTQIVDHQKAVQLYEWIIDNGQDSRLQSYAMEVLPLVMKHLEVAKGILSQLSGTVP